MGMVVRTNMAGLNANNALNMASKTQQNAMQKLASGFRINKAADDASGLAISEKMKNQIKALDTAADNCEDGANMIQTAEGYMNETHDILNRMTELAEKAANGILDQTDRDALQDEMDELCSEIDRIATTANFNGTKLMDGSLGGTKSVELSVNDVTQKIEYKSPKESPQQIGGWDIEGKIDAGSYKITGLSTDGVVTLEDAEGVSVTAQLANPFKTGDRVTISSGATAGVAANGVTVTLAAQVATTDQDLVIEYDGSKWTKVTGGPAATNVGDEVTLDTNTPYDFTNLKYDSNDSGAIDATDAKLDTLTNVGDVNVKAPVEGIVLQIGESSTSADRLAVKVNSFHSDTLFGGLAGFVNSSNDSTETDATTAVKLRNNYSNEDGNNKFVADLVGTDKKKFVDASSKGTSTYEKAVSIDITEKDAASAAADAIRHISNYVSDERGRLGAQQNRLEHTVNNLTTASENTTAANSRIRDTNMAEEMMSYTSKNVVAQAAQAMLAQANSQPQNVLSLLQ